MLLYKIAGSSLRPAGAADPAQHAGFQARLGAEPVDLSTRDRRPRRGRPDGRLGRRQDDDLDGPDHPRTPRRRPPAAAGAVARQSSADADDLARSVLRSAHRSPTPCRTRRAPAANRPPTVRPRRSDGCGLVRQLGLLQRHRARPAARAPPAARARRAARPGPAGWWRLRRDVSVAGRHGLRRRPGHRRILPRPPTGDLPVAGPDIGIDLQYSSAQAEATPVVQYQFTTPPAGDSCVDHLDQRPGQPRRREPGRRDDLQHPRRPDRRRDLRYPAPGRRLRAGHRRLPVHDDRDRELRLGDVGDRRSPRPSRATSTSSTKPATRSGPAGASAACSSSRSSRPTARS